jgi:SAM-dependent methyltransferase
MTTKTLIKDLLGMPASQSTATDSTGLAVLGLHGPTRALGAVLRSTFWLVMRTLPIGWLVTRVNLMRHRHLTDRKLEIGPGDGRVDGFETLDIVLRRNVDFVVDASRRLPFSDATFQLVYASHVLEHVPWYRLEETLREWVRIIKPGGVMEIWVPNGLEICRVFVEYETTGHDRTDQDGWYRFNPDKDPCLWAAGRIYTYGDGRGGLRSPNWHRAIFSPRFLQELMTKVGLVDVHEMDRADVRGYDHGWINLGFRGTKR